jgi:Thiolase, N-terminal domain
MQSSHTVAFSRPVRTAIGPFGGTLKDITAADLGAVAIKAAIERANIKPEAVETVVMGNVVPAGAKMNPARQAAIHAGVLANVPAMTVNRVCGSGAQAIVSAAAGRRQSFPPWLMPSLSQPASACARCRSIPPRRNSPGDTNARAYGEADTHYEIWVGRLRPIAAVPRMTAERRDLTHSGPSRSIRALPFRRYPRGLRPIRPHRALPTAFAPFPSVE